ncbi:hypothetical protein FOYG_15917 [Fusarium oxysporum NRRL 32931]|uniref:Uncharacterized protein n=1 Tax=Fusarium oxysporum NRRL 32931 TaxID=660029 RepID=W9HL29_FUSOX|nr:hypothetical protein FOYG_15917 [Fusarium oxysporum NRRL 32931]
MKFSILAQAILALPALATAIPEPVDTTEVDKRANCKLTLQWKSNWYENALRRYQVQLITSPRNDDHLGLYCNQFKVNAVQLENVQCFWTDGMYVLDVSEVQGPAGYAQYKNQHNLASKTFNRGTGCDVIQNL